MNDFLPSLLNCIFNYETIDQSATHTSEDSGTTIVYLIQLVFELICLIYIYKKVGKTIDYQKTLEEW